MPVISETTQSPVSAEEVSDAASPGTQSKPDAIKESTELPIEPVGVTDTNIPVQADETVTPTALPAADDKLDTATSTAPPTSGMKYNQRVDY